jgi:hypothetical protein
MDFAAWTTVFSTSHFLTKPIRFSKCFPILLEQGYIANEYCFIERYISTGCVPDACMIDVCSARRYVTLPPPTHPPGTLQ